MSKSKKKHANKMELKLQTLQQLWKQYTKWESIEQLFCDPSKCWVACVAVLVFEILVNFYIIQHRAYTEIDWVAYMQEVEGFVNGTLNYAELKGDTGPLVYPAGFVYVYTALYYITNHGQNIRLAQYIFFIFYLMTLLAVFRIYLKSKTVPPYALAFTFCTSYRIHSIFVLRLFNDPIAILLLYLAVNCFISNKWYFGSVLFSLAVSVKMNILLFAPALLFLYIATQGNFKTFINLTICALVQIILALPFLLTYPVSYITRSFDFGRVFFYEWTVNWRFLPESVFLHSYFHLLLLVLQAITLLSFFFGNWINYINLKGKQKGGKIVFSPNFAFSRSLHYQFYVWYYHSLPFLLWSTTLPSYIRLCILGIIELAWNIYPSTEWSSASLHICHLIIMIGLWMNRRIPQTVILKSK